MLDIDETGVTVKFQSRISKVARFRGRKRGGGDAEKAELDPARVRFRQMEQIWGVNGGKWMWGRIRKRIGRMGILP